METDPKIVREYQEKMREIADLSKQKDLGEKVLAEVKETIEREKKEWLTPLQDLIGTVNRNFGRYFTSMGCAGEVQLQKADDEVSISSVVASALRVTLSLELICMCKYV